MGLLKRSARGAVWVEGLTRTSHTRTPPVFIAGGGGGIVVGEGGREEVGTEGGGGGRKRGGGEREEEVREGGRRKWEREGGGGRKRGGGGGEGGRRWVKGAGYFSNRCEHLGEEKFESRFQFSEPGDSLLYSFLLYPVPVKRKLGHLFALLRGNVGVRNKQTSESEDFLFSLVCVRWFVGVLVVVDADNHVRIFKDVLVNELNL